LGAGPAIIVITATPLVNFVIGFFFGRRISSASIIGLVLIIGEVAMARWGGHFSAIGFAWIAFATVMNGILYEWFFRAKSPLLARCFWGSIGMGTLGLILSIRTSWAPIAEPQTILLIVGFAFVGGFLYWISNLVAFSSLPTIEASILAQGETPAVILGAGLLLGEHLTPIQWIGVGIALFGAWYLSRWLSKKGSQK
jgi:drug/metabolite transporter (DMT)-like permease